MNTLYYTISNLTETSNECTKLLINSLKNKVKNLNFKIIAPVETSNTNTNTIDSEILPYVMRIDLKNYSNNHLFGLKFHQNIFELDYDYFIYLDSDILYFLNDISFDPKYNYFCYDRCSVGSKFFSALWPTNFSIDKNSTGINAGFFMINKKTALDLYNFMVINFYNRRRIKTWYDQSMFNLFIYTNLISNEINWINYSENIVLFADSNTKFIENKIYHFCGNLCNMDLKHTRMKNFLHYNSIIL